MRLCEGHYNGLRRNLAELPALYAELAAYLVNSGAAGSGPGQSVGIVLDGAVVVGRDHIKHTLVSWARIALEEGPWRIAPQDTVADMARWLDARAEWLSNREWSDEIARNLAETASEGRRLVQPDKPYIVELGPCPELIGDEQTRCNGQVMAIMRRADSLLPSVVRCTTHGDDDEDAHAWGATEWHALGRRMGKALNTSAMAALVGALAG